MYDDDGVTVHGITKIPHDFQAWQMTLEGHPIQCLQRARAVLDTLFTTPWCFVEIGGSHRFGPLSSSFMLTVVARQK